MNRILEILPRIVIVVYLVSGVAFAQNSPNDTLSTTALKKVEAFFSGNIKEQSRIFNGPVHYVYGSNVGGSAFFGDSTISKGTVVYEGISYRDVPLIYDMYLDKLVSINNGELFSMLSDRISDFYLLGHHFVNIKNVGEKSIVAPGFYDLIYDGKMSIFAKRERKLGFSVNKDAPNYFKAKVAYYVERNGEYEEVGSEGDFLNLLGDKKNEVKRNLSSSKIKFSKNPEEALIAMATYYESLNK